MPSDQLTPGLSTPSIQALLATCCGLADTELGPIDFTGCWFPKEPCAVFQPCLTLAIDDAGRRWIAESGDRDLPGPVWCVFPDPQVAVHVCDDLPAFLATLHEHAHRGQTLAWLQDLTLPRMPCGPIAEHWRCAPTVSTARMRRFGVGYRAYPPTPMSMTCGGRVQCAVGPMVSRGRRGACIAADVCRCSRSRLHPRKVGAPNTRTRLRPSTRSPR